jgi:glyoxylase-like metal-dependent hydrolase (beta-lactamase superfamily II)
MKLKRIGSNIILFQLSEVDSNIYLINGDTVVDAGTGFNFPLLKQMFKASKNDFEKVSQVINTHSHFDHIGGDGYFYNATISVHERGAEVLEKADIEKSCADFYDGKLMPRKVAVRLKDGDVIKAGGMELQVIHTPGHTDDSICLFDKKSGIMFTGDTIFADGLGSAKFINSDAGLLKKSLEKISKLNVVQYLPGHGETVEKMGSRRMQTLMKEVGKIETADEDEEEE